MNFNITFQQRERLGRMESRATGKMRRVSVPLTGRLTIPKLNEILDRERARINTGHQFYWILYRYDPVQTDTREKHYCARNHCWTTRAIYGLSQPRCPKCGLPPDSGP